jgi:hypothetical protein
MFTKGDEVRTPAHGVCTVIGFNSGPARGRQWREVRVNVQVPGLSYPVWYYESELELVGHVKF